LFDLPRLPAIHPRSQEDDDDLLCRLREGERTAQGEFFRAWVQYVAQVARAGGANSDLDDVVQETFLAAFDSIEALTDDRALRGWLARITLRQIARRRRFRSWLTLFARPADESKAWEELLDPSSPADVVAEVRFAGQVLDTLRAEERLAWILRHWHDLTLEETAAACNTSLATIKRRLGRAGAALDTWRKASPP